MDNPLLQCDGLPRFSAIEPHHVVPAIEAVLAENRAAIKALLERNGPYTWGNLVQPLEDLADRLARVWSPVSHMNSVVNSPALREAYNTCLPLLSAYATELGQNESLYQAYRAIAERDDFHGLEQAQRKIIENALRDFRLSGIALDKARKARYKAIVEELSTLTACFEQNLLDATHAWSKPVTESEKLAGLPESALAQASQAAQRKGMEGWLFTLEFPSYNAVMTYAEDRELRREIYEAYVTRASDEGPHGGRWDNTPVMERILSLRHEEAQLLGFANYAERSLATKMASRPSQVMDFLNDLAARTRDHARMELEELRAYAREYHGHNGLEAWDVAYYSEKLRQQRFTLSQEELKPYFPEDRVLDGLFAVVRRLFGLEVARMEGVDVWHKDVRFYEVRDAQGEVRGSFYLDLYARPDKRGGAWMDECIVRRRTADGLQLPVAYLTCNFTPPLGDDPALFTHDEVVTLFHEFGHGLHHMLTQVDYAGVAGIQGVAWDAVELPSQFMENWCWEREAIGMFSGHYQTGAPLPGGKFNSLLAARNFQSGMKMVRQLEFAIFDFRLHLEYDPERGAGIDEILAEVRQQVAVIHPPSFNRFPHSFAHIFAGGYSAGYYSYKWAEVLSSDAFSLFEEKGIFDAEAGMRFLQVILEQGGSRDPLELFIEFRGREPQIDALLRHSGLAA